MRGGRSSLTEEDVISTQLMEPKADRGSSKEMSTATVTSEYLESKVFTETAGGIVTSLEQPKVILEPEVLLL